MFIKLKIAFVLSFLLVACAGDVNPVRDIAVSLGFGPPERERPEFLRSDKTSYDYLPIRNIQNTEVKSQEELLEMELDLKKRRDNDFKKAEIIRKVGLLPDPDPVIIPQGPEILPDPEPVIIESYIPLEPDPELPIVDDFKKPEPIGVLQQR